MTTESNTTDSATDAESHDRPQGGTDSTSLAESFSDPETLRDAESVTFTEETRVHDDRDHCAVGIEGRSVIGVTNDEGAVLLAVHTDASVAMLPHGKVEPGDGWATVGRRTVEELTDVTVEIDGIDCVREITHLAEGEDDPHDVSYNVIFSASPVGDEKDADEPGTDDVWNAGWFDDFPADLTDEAGVAEDDIRLFFD